jgi:hypothetical protein
MKATSSERKVDMSLEANVARLDLDVLNDLRFVCDTHRVRR